MSNRPKSHDSDGASDIARTFSPDELDLDQLAEAIRRLLNTDTGDDAQIRRDPDLLSRRRRATHVMGSQGLEVPGS